MALRGVTELGQPLISENLEANLLSYFDSEFLNLGNYYNFYLNTSGAFGGNFSRLRLSEDGNYTAGQVWEGVRKQWVWQSGVSYATSPIQISGVYVNNTFYPSATTGAYAHKIDYMNGRIIFASPISVSAVVRCEHSPKIYQFYHSDAESWRKLQQDSFRVDSSEFLMLNSGAWSLPVEQRMQLPALVFHTVPNVRREAREIGGLHQWHTQEVRAHILTSNNNDMKFLHDVLTNQWESNVSCFSLSDIAAANDEPLNYDGTLSATPKDRTSLLNTYPDTDVRIERISSQPVIESPTFNYTIVKMFLYTAVT